MKRQYDIRVRQQQYHKGQWVLYYYDPRRYQQRQQTCQRKFSPSYKTYSVIFVLIYFFVLVLVFVNELLFSFYTSFVIGLFNENHTIQQR